MEANRNSLPIKTLDLNNRSHQVRPPRADSGGYPLRWHANLLGCARARKPCCYCFASAFVPISDENQDGGCTFPANFCGAESQLRFAGSGSHSPPRWRTRERRSDLCDFKLPWKLFAPVQVVREIGFVPALRKTRAIRNMFGRQTS